MYSKGRLSKRILSSLESEVKFDQLDLNFALLEE
jgi:hypothetical protein